MAKKRKAQSPKQSLSKLRERAENALHRGDFREAVELHKQLLKRESRAEFQEGLAAAYLGRAGELAAKGMYKEAAALWENMAGSCGEREPGRYIEWLLLGGRLERAVRRLQQADEAFRKSPAGARTSTLLALQLLGHPEAAGEALPADSPWLAEREAMLAALRAYCAGEDDTLREALRGIPFRSPYRDLRTLLQALAARDSDPASARAQLQRIPPSSPLSPLARALVEHGDADPQALLSLPVPLRNFLVALQGWTPGQREALSRFPHGDPDSPKAVLRFALGLEGVDEALLRRFCLAWLPRYPEGVASVERRLGKLSPAERTWVKARTGELQRDFDTSDRHWPDCAEALAAEGNPLAAALVFRHLAYGHDRAMGGDPWDPTTRDYLERGLALDPDDRLSYLKLADMARGRHDLQAQQAWAQRAVERFPEDVQVRLLASNVAYRRQAFRQAVEHARAALARDSLNPGARALLLISHVGLARQHIKRGHHQRAHEELDKVASEATGPEQREILALVRSLVCLGGKQRDEAQRHLREAIDGLGQTLATRFRFLVHGRRMHIAQGTLTRLYNQLSPASREPATPAVLMELADLIKRFRVDGDVEIQDTLGQLHKPLKDAARQKLDEDQYRRLLDALYQVESHALLAHYGRAAIRHHGVRPRFQFYEIYGRNHGDVDRLNYTDRTLLRFSLSPAIAEEDHETVRLIEDFLDEGPGFLPGDLDLPGGLPPMPPEVRQIMEAIMDKLGTDDPLEALEFLMNLEDDEDDEDDDFPPLPPLPPFPPRGRRR